MMSGIRIDARSVAPQRWRNGGGWTRELLTWPDANAWQLRISLATIEAAGPFSEFAGVQRSFTVIAGAGVSLQIDDAVQHLDLDSDPVRFAGSAAVFCAPLAGPTSDLNLMTRDGHGELRRVRSGVSWSAADPQRGVFTRLPGRFSTSAGVAAQLPAQSLLWLEAAAGVAFSFAPDRPDSATPAWWLAFTPAG